MKKIFLIIFSSVILISILTPEPAFAQTLLKGHECLYDNKIVTMDCIAPLFANLIYWLIILSGTVAVFLILFGGIKFLTSSGDQQKVESAKKTITWAIIGLVVVLLSFMIVNIVADITGVNCISKFGFTSCSRTGTLERCGPEHPTGWCRLDKEVCTRVDSGVYQCVVPCSVAQDKDGWCYSGKCTEVHISTTKYWTCR